MKDAGIITRKKIEICFGSIKFFLFLTLLFIFLIHHSIAYLMIRQKRLRLNYYIQSISFYSKAAQKILCIKVKIDPQNSLTKSCIIVANHQSYIDILIIAAIFPSVFITSNEIKETPILGYLCKLAGCSFVERRKSMRSEETKTRELEEIKKRIQDGSSITFFPEATSTNGHKVIPFKSHIFQTAIDTHSSVLPLVIKYREKSKDMVPWYGEMTFLGHLFKLCQLNEIKVTLKVLDPIWKNDRFLLAENAHEKISLNYY